MNSRTYPRRIVGAMVAALVLAGSVACSKSEGGGDACDIFAAADQHMADVFHEWVKTHPAGTTSPAPDQANVVAFNEAAGPFQAALDAAPADQQAVFADLVRTHKAAVESPSYATGVAEQDAEAAVRKTCNLTNPN